MPDHHEKSLTEIRSKVRRQDRAVPWFVGGTGQHATGTPPLYLMFIRELWRRERDSNPRTAPVRVTLTVLTVEAMGESRNSKRECKTKSRAQANALFPAFPRPRRFLMDNEASRGPGCRRHTLPYLEASLAEGQRRKTQKASVCPLGCACQHRVSEFPRLPFHISISSSPFSLA